MSNIFYVYVHRKLSDNNVFYVGKGNGYRAYQKNKRNDFWQNVVKKHGYLVEIVLNNLTEQQAFNLEKELIKYYGRKNLCNLTDGGDGTSGHVQSCVTKKKLKEIAIKQFSCPIMIEEHKKREKKKWESLELREKMSNIIKEYEKDPEVRKKMSERAKKAWEKEGFREKMSKMRIEQFSTEEMKIKLSNGQKKRFENPKFLKEHQNRQEKLRKPVFCETTGKTYKSQSEAAKDLGISQGGISQVVKGSCKTYKGYVFKEIK